MTDDMLERLESQLADTIAFVATFIATADNTEKATFHPCLKFLANWLECEDRAVTSHQIGTELISCARAALALGDLDLLGRFLSGFYKATNDEASAVAYFTKTELIELVLSALTLSNKPIREICHQLLIEYLVFIEDNDKKLDMDMLSRIYEAVKVDAIDDTAKFTLLFKLLGIKWDDDGELLENGIAHVARAYTNGKLNDDFIDVDIPGTPQADISWVRCCHYLIKLGKQRREVADQIKRSDWPREIVAYVTSQATVDETSGDQQALAIFSTVLDLIDY